MSDYAINMSNYIINVISDNIKFSDFNKVIERKEG